MAVITFKCTDAEKEAFQDYCDKKGVGVSAELRRLINDASEHRPERIDIHTLLARVEALETKFHQLKEDDEHQDISFAKPQKKLHKGEPVNIDQLGELITKKEAEALTGYSVNTLNRTFSQKGVHEVSKRGKAGLYSKAEILERIGIK